MVFSIQYQSPKKPWCSTSSDDEEVRNATQDNSMSCNQLLLERVICKTFTYHQCNVIITDRIRSLFANKLSRMGKAMYKL